MLASKSKKQNKSMGMEKLFYSADRYIKKSGWKDLAMLKFCLFSIGVLAGMCIAEKDRKTVRAVAAAVITLTYIPLMTKFLSVIMEEEGK